MKLQNRLTALALMALAGQASAQITIDGVKDAAYGDNLWVQNLPTQFGDNVEGDRDLCTGSEFDNFSAVIIGDQLYMFLGGNLETNYNKWTIMLDCIPGEGQNIIRNNNVDVDYNGINRIAGMKLDANVAVDYWINVTNGAGGGPSGFDMYTNAATLRTDGALFDGSSVLDYSSFVGGDKLDFNPLFFNGTRIDPQTGGLAAVYANYAPRKASESLLVDPLNPVGIPGLLGGYIDNTNTEGVDGGGVINPEAVTTGLELQIDLAELGWTGTNPIKVVAFINGSGNDYLSNQVAGGMPDGTNNLGEPTLVDFTSIDGNQWVAIPCPADFNRDGFVNGDDYDAFASLFDVADSGADFNHDGFVNGDDYDAFASRFDVGC
ncbi:MAG: hypothetical protein IT434_07850 [Phycisphaerales bacterium]|jgi:hypothetical protein|nr:hypothetical protein [Phycisphaerales bacterium]